MILIKNILILIVTYLHTIFQDFLKISLKLIYGMLEQLFQSYFKQKIYFPTFVVQLLEDFQQIIFITQGLLQKRIWTCYQKKVINNSIMSYYHSLFIGNNLGRLYFDVKILYYMIFQIKCLYSMKISAIL
ncbi:hypothetical protein TTHERM_000204119 (macronuclear) [Tetrahymena thermophila SB210]|uniref:Uncharacterized protein n=1 Tax=Tetrahymena thermophila (strain SB210) TaxID=312017 RepID=W7XHE2_TETTS|nr:hypothetical protein TTHERM_000204119 [Tetrahymena thermophila SB210]EWS76653.1 hypothetical protein TTHERM_000204119 [Tetrahymena thermophila SB210]|eukprot:XP_012650821.1 hypothetical protein TTHERM_000204119 [Tetrahymena thermophila SB210]